MCFKKTSQVCDIAPFIISLSHVKSCSLLNVYSDVNGKCDGVTFTIFGGTKKQR